MMARGFGGRGRGFGGNRPRGGSARPITRFISRPTFDPVLAEPAFPRVKPLPEETEFNQDLLNLNAQLSPTEEEEAAINNLMTKVRGILDKFILAPVAESSCQIEEVRPVGSYKKGTMMRGSNMADLVVILKSMPARQAVDAMGMKLCQELEQQDPKLGATFTSNERGFHVSSGSATIRIMTATVPVNMKKLDSSLHLDYKILQQNMAAVRQCRWFEESAHHSSIRVLIRILKHLKNRYELLNPLTPWMVDLLAHYCIMNQPNRLIVSLPAAFRRALQLMAAGLFLPGSQGES
ncbi:interleukin enhancer-binding factor 2-like [Artemia franciscana]|uniref:interleukin enhancer-binding factor 2-like n=1 Tax=Artemia franciscana TaxID=6661 RepID=UPI0032D9BA17